VISEALKHQVNLETSSSFDIDLIMKLYKEGKLQPNFVDKISFFKAYNFSLKNSLPRLK